MRWILCLGGGGCGGACVTLKGWTGLQSVQRASRTPDKSKFECSCKGLSAIRHQSAVAPLIAHLRWADSCLAPHKRFFKMIRVPLGTSPGHPMFSSLKCAQQSDARSTPNRDFYEFRGPGLGLHGCGSERFGLSEFSRRVARADVSIVGHKCG